MGLRLKAKNAVGYESVGMVSVNADSKALPKGNQAPQEQQKPRWQNNTPVHEIISEWKNWCVVTVGQWNAAANRT